MRRRYRVLAIAAIILGWPAFIIAFIWASQP